MDHFASEYSFVSSELLINLRHKVKCNFLSSDSEIDDQVASLTKRVSSNVWECSDCGKQASQRTDLKKHIEAVHLSLHLPCDLCGVSFKTRHSRQNHVRTAHGYSSKDYNY